MVENGLRIEPVTSRRELKDLIKFPFKLYRDSPYWVPPLISERMEHFSDHNPFFEHAEMQMFRARRDGQTVGTIAAIDDPTHEQVWGENIGFFGVFECIEDYAVAKALLDAASDWLAKRGREAMRGPANLNVNDEYGLLVDGFDGMPVIMMPYNWPYYADLLERYGMAKAKDIYAYKANIAGANPDMAELPERVLRVADLARDRYKVTMRHIDLKQIARETELLRPIYRAAWAKNWGALPVTDAEFDYLVKQLKQVADPELTYLAFIDDKPVGCFVALPDYCQVAKHLNGRLLPFGWAKYLWYKRKITGIRVPIMGVLEEHRLKGIEALFYKEGFGNAVRKGYKWAESSWILEDNYKVRRGIEMMGGHIYRTYRLYQKAVS